MVVAVGLMSIVGLIFATMTTNQQKEVRGLRENLAVEDFQKSMIAALANGNVCMYMLQGMYGNSPVMPGVPWLTKFNFAMPAAAVPFSPGPPVVARTATGPAIATPDATTSVSPVASELVLDTSVNGGLELDITTPPAVPPAGATITYTGSWIANFSPQGLVRPLPPVKVAVQITVDKVTKVVQSCNSSAGGSNLGASIDSPIPAQTFTWPGGPAGGITGGSKTTLKCPPGQVVTGLVVYTHGTCSHQCDPDGSIINQLQLVCTQLN